ncbi:MAG: YfcE family phosphodiesterase [Candidatus Thermoplasmatota archaeon]
MKLGIVADSHGNLEYLKKALEFLIRAEVDELVHLGDDYEDLDNLEIEVKLLRVPGVFSHLYKDPNIPNRVIKNYKSWRILITHTKEAHENDLPQDIKPEVVTENKEVDIVLYAHTHIPNLELSNNILWLNPGHLKKEDKKGFNASLGILEIEEDVVKAKIIELVSGKAIYRYELKK